MAPGVQMAPPPIPSPNEDRILGDPTIGRKQASTLGSGFQQKPSDSVGKSTGVRSQRQRWGFPEGPGATWPSVWVSFCFATVPLRSDR